MLELLFVWIVSAAAVGFVAVLGGLLLRHLLTSLGRVVFFETQKTDTTLGHNAV